MHQLSCRACGESLPASWNEILFVEGRRVIACPTCGARYLWFLWHRASLVGLRHDTVEA
jgi:DNA-directed RNA polymerase subunit RPC12/RpoP